MSSNAGLQLITRCVGSGIALLGDRRAFHALVDNGDDCRQGAGKPWNVVPLGPLGPLTRGIMVRFSRLKSLFYPKSIYCLLFAVALLGAASLRACSVRC
jgi:hypothetical protein